MATDEHEGLKTPLIQQYNKAPELSVSHIFKLRPEELTLFFRKEHLELPENKGEKRESLVILEKVGLYRGLLKCLGTEGDTGIIGDEKDIKRRQTFFGSNEKRLPKIKSYFNLLRNQFEDQTLRILLVAATLTLIIGLFSDEDSKWIEGASIYFAVAFIALFTAGSDYMKEKQFLKLHEEIKNEEVSVIRGQYGLSQPAKVFEVVVGDVIIVEAGSRVPADCILIDGMDITVDEALYNDGQETIVKKSLSDGQNHRENPDPFLLAGSLVMTGAGRAVVCCVGKYTQLARTKEEENLEDDDEHMTPLQEKLEKMAGLFGKYAYFAGFIIFCSMCLFLVCKLLFTESQLLSNTTLMKLLDFFTIAVTVVIVAVPEGLPLAVSLSMAFSIDTMKNDQLLVKNLEACETMGTVTEICTGKTATLTKNDMSVNSFFTVGQSIPNTSATTFTSSGLNETVVNIIRDCIIYNCDARVEMSEEARYEPQGNGTEVGMLKFLQINDFSIQDLLSQRQRQGKVETIIPFGPIRKRQVVAIRPSINDEFVRVVVKGAPEYVMPFCTQQLTENGELEYLDGSENARILEQEIVGKFAKKGLRTLVYAYKDVDVDEWERIQADNNNFENEKDRDILESDLAFVAAFGLNDDLRFGVDVAIRKLFDGGINVRMISGDNLYTAIECAKKAGILQEGEEKIEKVCMLGKDFRELVGGVRKVQDKEGNEKWEVLNKANFKQVAQRLKVLARSTPEDKFSLIVGLKEVGASVAVTADGINDAPALKHANVGFCMGISGVEVAKESSDIVILDDNFTSVFKAAQWGRSIYDNIRKFIQFQMTINIVAVIIVFLGGATLGESPFSVIQLLWINMIMDTLAAISLATEPPHPTELKKERVKKHDRIIVNVMWRNVLSQVIYQLLVLITLLYFAPLMFDTNYDYYSTPFYVDYKPTLKTLHYTLVFHTFVLMNLFNQIASRKLGVRDFNILERFFNNFYFIVVLVGEFVAQWFMVELGGRLIIFRTMPLPWTMHIAALSFGIGALIVNAITKATPEEWLEKIPVLVNEDAGDEGNDILSRMHQRVTSKVKKSETERLLDSN